MAKFALELRFDRDNARRMEIRPAHRDYVRSLFDAGKIVMSGPYADDSGALLIYEVADEAEMRAILNADPYTPAGVVTVVSLRAWTPVIGV